MECSRLWNPFMNSKPQTLSKPPAVLRVLNLRITAGDDEDGRFLEKMPLNV